MNPRDRLALAVARHLPLRVRYWATVNMIGLATMKPNENPVTTVGALLELLPHPDRMTGRGTV